MKVSLIQMNSINDKAANIAAARGLIERAIAEEKPDWILLPEQFDWAGGVKGDKARNAEALPGGPAYAMAQELAEKHGVFIHAGSIMERIEGDERIHNTTVAFDRQGAEIARYRKIHLFDVTTPDGVDLSRKRDGEGGRSRRHLRLRGGHGRLLDLLRPALSRVVPGADADKGAQVIALPAAFTAANRQGPLGECCCAPARSRRETYLVRRRADRDVHGQQRDARRPTAIRWSPTPGASWSPRPPTGSAWSRRGSTWRMSRVRGA